MESLFNIVIGLRPEAFMTEHLRTTASVTQL